MISGSATIGYIEAKDIGRSLDEAAKTEQLKRYLPSLSNLILLHSQLAAFRDNLIPDLSGRRIEILHSAPLHSERQKNMRAVYGVDADKKVVVVLAIGPPGRHL